MRIGIDTEPILITFCLDDNHYQMRIGIDTEPILITFYLDDNHYQNENRY